MQPSVGRIVHYIVSPSENNGSGIAPAIITRVWNDTCVNIRVFCDGGTTPWQTSVLLYPDQVTLEETCAKRAAENGWDRPVLSGAFWPPKV